MNETSPSQYWREIGMEMVRYMGAGMDVGQELGEIMKANNNWRKMHGLPTYHRNRPSMRRADFYKLKQWEVEHREDEQ